jgi:hypothetical protein
MVPLMLSGGMKTERVRISREFLERSEKESEDYLNKIITSDETLVRYVPESKSRPCNIAKRNDLSRKKIQNSGLGWKGHIDCFWNSEPVVLADFLENETTIKSQR